MLLKLKIELRVENQEFDNDVIPTLLREGWQLDKEQNHYVIRPRTGRTHLYTEYNLSRDL